MYACVYSGFLISYSVADSELLVGLMLLLLLALWFVCSGQESCLVWSGLSSGDPSNGLLSDRVRCCDCIDSSLMGCCCWTSGEGAGFGYILRSALVTTKKIKL